MMKQKGLWTLVTLSLVLILSVSMSYAAPAKVLLSYGTTSKASGYYAAHVSIATLMNKYVPEVGITPIETGATIDNWRRIGKNEIQLGFCSGMADYQAYHGIGAFEGNPVKIGRILIQTDYTVMSIMVRADSGIKTVRDLEGKRFNGGIPGSLIEETSRWYVKLLGIPNVKMETSSVAEAITSMQDGRIDAWFKGGAHPDSAILSLMATTKIGIISFSDAELEKLFADRPYLAKYIVPAGTYKGLPQYQSFGNYEGVVTRGDLPQALQYKLFKALFEHYDEFITANPSWKQFPHPREITTKSLVPLAAGTVQYLEEKGIPVPKQIIPPEYKKP